MTAFLSDGETPRKARKTYRCSVCREPIEKGTYYYRTAHVTYGYEDPDTGAFVQLDKPVWGTWFEHVQCAKEVQ